MAQTATALKRSTPESAGIHSKNILGFIDEIETNGIEVHSVMVLRHGLVLAEGWWQPYRADDVHLLYSLSKSFTSTAIGFAIQEGRLGLDDRVLSFFPEEAPQNPSANLAAMKVRHLLTMSTGHDADTWMPMRVGGPDWAATFLAQEVLHEPGTHFLYNSGATYMLSAILTRLTGQSALDYLRPRLFDPLGIDRATWNACPKGVSIGASDLSVSTESIARLGQFYLQKGVWNGERLLSESWIEDATRKHVPNGPNGWQDWAQGYGFQFWRCTHECFRGDGAFGQFCVVIPNSDMVIAITSSTSELQAVLDLVWKHLLEPATAEPLPEDPEYQAKLVSRLTNLALPAPTGSPQSTLTLPMSGRQFRCENGSLAFEFDENGSRMVVSDSEGSRALAVGSSDWVHGEWPLGPDKKKAAAIGAWTSEDTYEIKLRYTESPAGIVWVNQFENDVVTQTTTETGRFNPFSFRELYDGSGSRG